MEIPLPKLIERDDYHDFHHFETDLQCLNSRFRCAEIGIIEREAPRSTYLGVVYTGKMPSKKKLQQMVADQDFGGEVELD